MLRLVACVVLSCTVSFGFPYPYPVAPVPVVPPIVPPVVLPVAPAYPLAPTTRPVIPGVAGYNPLLPGVAGYRNPLVPGAAGYNPLLPGVAGYRNPLVPGAAGYNPLIPGVAGYRNPLVPEAAGYNPLIPGVAGYKNPLVPGAAGYNNPYYDQYRASGAAVPILTYSSDHVGDGTYSFSFTTADGKQAQEAGYLKDAYIDNAGEPQGTQVVQGSYAYVSPDGTPIQVNYIADENGFRPSGVHIPADGKAAVPLIGDKENQLLDPLYNRYDPRYRNRYNGVGAYNRPYDPKNSYEAAKYSPYYNNQYLAPGLNQDTKDLKKSA